MEVTVVMTTYNRPKLLAQSLPQVERETARIGAKLLIADDLSTDSRTIDLLKAAMDRGHEVVHRAPYREVPEDPHERNVAAHQSIGLNNLFAFNYAIENYPGEYILKVDDDTFLADGAFEKMIWTQEAAERDGNDVACTSGIRTINEPVIVESMNYIVTFAACNVAVIYRKEDWKIIIGNYSPAHVASDGFDIFFMRTFKPRFRPDSIFICTNPSVVYHTGFTGIHVFGEDINVNFDGEPRSIYSE